MQVFVFDFSCVESDATSCEKARLLCPSHRCSIIDQTPHIRRKMELMWGWMLLRYAFFKVGAGDVNTMQYSLSAKGKPYFVDCPFQYSLSHSNTVCAVAAAQTAVGLDIEKYADMRSRLAARFFSATEREYIAQSTDPNRAFFEIFTAKESYMKYTGEGFALPMSSFSTDLHRQKVEEVPFAYFSYGDYIGSLCGSRHVEVLATAAHDLLEMKIEN